MNTLARLKYFGTETCEVFNRNKTSWAGLILLAAAPCTAMVFVWSHLTRGNPAYTVVQVATNDLPQANVGERMRLRAVSELGGLGLGWLRAQKRA